MAARKERLDVLLMELGHFDSREKARRAIMAGVVTVGGQLEDKPGTFIDRASDISVRTKPIPFVSRGGLKLQKALGYFALDVGGFVAVDVGASTGGFTDCLLQSGASKVYAVDVGYGQLSWSLRTDPRVVSLERTNIRYFDVGLIVDPIDMVTVDTAFISVTKFSGKLHELLRPGGFLVLLIKPQFEAGADKVGKKGVVRDPKVHASVIKEVLCHYLGAGFYLLGLTYSPVRGPEGNIEFLALLSRGSADPQVPVPADTLQGMMSQADEVVRTAHADGLLT